MSSEGEHRRCGCEGEGLDGVVSAAGHDQSLWELFISRHHAHTRHKVVLATHNMTLSVTYIMSTTKCVSM